MPRAQPSAIAAISSPGAGWLQGSLIETHRPQCQVWGKAARGRAQQPVWRDVFSLVATLVGFKAQTDNAGGRSWPRPLIHASLGKEGEGEGLTCGLVSGPVTRGCREGSW